MFSRFARGCGRVAPGGLALVLLAGPWGCGGKPGVRQPRVPVTVARAEVRDLPFELEANGNVEARQTASINSQVGGVIQRVAFHEGDEVREGQVLFLIDPAPFRAALTQAAAMLARDRAQYENARLESERAVQLVAQNYISAEEADQKKAAAQALLATVRADSANAVIARLNLDYATIRAPFAGRTGNLHVHPGDLVKANDVGNPMVSLNQIHPILVRFAIPERQLPLIQRQGGRALQVSARPSGSDTASLSGTLSFMDNTVDATTGTILMKAQFENRQSLLWPGEFVDVRVVVYVQHNACVVPAPAVNAVASGNFVYVLQPDTTVARRDVTVERTVGNLAVVSAGLKAGETVITDGQLRLAPGLKVILRGGRPGGLEAGK